MERKLTFSVYCLYLLSNAAFNQTVLALLLLKQNPFSSLVPYEVCFKKKKPLTTMHNYSVGGFLFCFVGGYQVSSKTGR